MKLSQALTGYTIARSADGYSPNTIAVYTWAINLLTSFLHDPPLDSITPADLRAFFKFLRTEYTPTRPSGDKRPLSGSSIENAWKAIRSLYTWASLELDLPRPDNNLPRPRYTSKEIHPLTETEIKALLTACTSTKSAATTTRKPFTMHRPTAKRDKALLLTLLDTGLRASETARLTLHDLDLKTGELLVIPFGSGQKTKSRYVYLGKSARSAVWAYIATRFPEPAPSDPLFVTEDNTPMDRNSIRHLLMGLGSRANVRNVHPHRFRHTFAIQYLRNGGDVFTLQRLLGHATLEMVRKYLTLAESDSAAAHHRASPADRWNLK